MILRRLKNLRAKRLLLRGNRFFCFFAFFVLSTFGASSVKADLTVFAAASLTDVMGNLVSAFEKQSGHAVRLVTGGSSSLARQIVSGAPADVFVSANLSWAQHVAADEKFGAPRSLFGNALVVVSNRAVEVSPDLHELPALLQSERLAMGDPLHVPAGIYAKAALEAAGVWTKIEPRLVPAADVRSALAYIVRGAAAYGLVYATDVREGAEIVAHVDPSFYPKISYYAVASNAPSLELTAFQRYLESVNAEKIITGMGFLSMEMAQE